MRLISLNVGMPRDVLWQGKMVTTGIFKDPVSHPVVLRSLNFDGDAQADLTVHGGPDKAVYAYSSEHYDGWQSQLGRGLPPGAFGENLTTEGMTENLIHIGDEFRVGAARLVVTQPRLPCYKLGLRFENTGMIKTFLKAGKPGIYFAVQEEGFVHPGEAIEPLAQDENRITVSEMFHLILDRRPDPAAIRRLLQVNALAAAWRQKLEALLKT